MNISTTAISSNSTLLRFLAAAAAAAADILAGRHDAGSAVCAPLAVDPSCPARCWVTSNVATFPNSTLAPSSLLLLLLLIPPLAITIHPSAR